MPFKYGLMRLRVIPKYFDKAGRFTGYGKAEDISDTASEFSASGTGDTVGDSVGEVV